MKKITSEEPKEHWSFLNIKDKIVLDLGCGKFYSSISTAQWFLDEGAAKVIGVDLSKEPIQNEKFAAYAKPIKGKEDLEYFLHYMPEIIKCDIEGAERYFKDVDFLPSSVKQFAVEYHDAETKKICEDQFLKWGFTHLELYQLFNESTDRIGVYHAWK
jgi:SAM-dependent methyltransferase